MSPDLTESTMIDIEEYERLGLINLGDSISVVEKVTGPDLSADTVSLKDKAIENPFALDGQGRPGLRLVTTDDDGR
jgi:hypothetical protein